MIILGINAYHPDSAACIIREGELIAAAEEERFRRIKHWAGLPTEAIQYCFEEARIGLGEVDHIAINRKPGVNTWRRLLFVLRHRPDFQLIRNRIQNIHAATSIEETLHAAFPGETCRARVHRVEHHRAHLASAFFASDFENAVCLSLDGFGDFASAAWGMGRGRSIDVDGRIYFPHSLGVFYSAITQFLGFPHFGDEYKVMGLASYGEPRYVQQMRQIVLIQPDGSYKLNLSFFNHHLSSGSYTWKDCAPEVGVLYSPALEELFGPSRKQNGSLEQTHKDLARSAQAIYEEAFFALLNELHKKYQCSNLAFAGGCALNSVANGKTYLRSPFKKMNLPAATGDAGGAVGAALVVCGQLADDSFHRSVSAYLGPQFGDEEIEALLRRRGLHWTENTRDTPNKTGHLIQTTDQGASQDLFTTRFLDLADLCRIIAHSISSGAVVGWFQGRMEWGPRALGNRSILCDPRRRDMKEILNEKIKRRESFRPFAPSILREHVAEWFEQEADVPFMTQVYQVRKEKRPLVPAITHVDGSGRLQTVHKETNPLFHQLIMIYHQLTGIPLLLNTSFNENEPIVCHPEEALDCFLRTKMDVLVLGSFYLERTKQMVGPIKSNGNAVNISSPPAF